MFETALVDQYREAYERIGKYNHVRRCQGLELGQLGLHYTIRIDRHDIVYRYHDQIPRISYVCWDSVVVLPHPHELVQWAFSEALSAPE